MTADDFKAWRERHRLTILAAADALGCHRNSITSWEARRTIIPRYIALACQALSAKWRESALHRPMLVERHK